MPGSHAWNQNKERAKLGLGKIPELHPGWNGVFLRLTILPYKSPLRGFWFSIITWGVKRWEVRLPWLLRSQTGQYGPQTPMGWIEWKNMETFLLIKSLYSPLQLTLCAVTFYEFWQDHISMEVIGCCPYLRWDRKPLPASPRASIFVSRTFSIEGFGLNLCGILIFMWNCCNLEEANLTKISEVE